MRKIHTFLLFVASFWATLNAQSADPAVTGAYFATSPISVGDQVSLIISFANSGSTPIPSNSIAITVSTPATFYTTNGTSNPMGPGADYFTWEYQGSDTWRGTNNSPVMPFLGGDIIFNVEGLMLTNGAPTTSINVMPVDSFNYFNDFSTNNSQLPGLQVNAALACVAPTPKIIGDFYGCKGTNLAIRVDTFTAGNTYDWSVSGNAHIVNTLNGNVTVSLPNVSSGSYTLVLKETTPGGCIGTDAVVLKIENNSILVCDDNVQITLDSNCSIVITPDILLEGQPYPNDSYGVVVKDEQGTILPTTLVGANLIGKKLQVSVTHTCSGNSCWGYVHLEDKLAPVIRCPDTLEVSCFFTGPYIKPVAFDNCDVSVPVVEISNDLETLDCGDEFAAIRTIRHKATDDYGNVSAICNQVIVYHYENIDSIKFPLGHDDVHLPAYSCSNSPKWDLNNNGYPDIEESGYPTINGEKLKENNGLCKINSIYADQRIDICANSFKIIRTWTILDWCSGRIINGTQVIKILDKEGPIVTCAPDFQAPIYTDPYSCTGSYTVPDPIVVYDCGVTSYSVAYLLADATGNPPIDGDYITDNIVFSNGKYTINNLPKGLTWIKYTVKDACNNETECFSEVYVQDNVPPVAVCDQNTVVSLTNTGFAQVFASTFDDGSLDNCGKVDFKVARMQAGCGENTSFKPAAIFCCEDIGKELMVRMRVWDDANCNGIFGDEIDVYADTNHSGIFGDVVQGVPDRLIKRVSDNYNDCMVNIKVQDKANPIITCPADVTLDCGSTYEPVTTGQATAVDNCSPVTVTYTQSGSLNNCNLGTITRNWLATDKAGLTASCSQRIIIRDFTPFTVNNINWNTVPNRNLEGCADHDTSPEALGKPTWTSDECSLVAASYEDQVFHIVDSVCVKILRRWTILDWCTYNESVSTTIGKYEYIQVIKITNSVAPTFTTCKDITACIYGENCNGPVELLHPATDDCTPTADLKYLYTIDLDNNGTVDRTGGTMDASGTFSPGKHKVTVEVQDGCGNYKDCSYLLTVKDCKAPTPYCYGELITVVMNDPNNMSVSIWARDFDLGSYDNCPGTLKFSFSTNTLDTGRVFTCDDLGLQELQMWVTDASGNSDFCKVRVDIQSNPGVCPGSRFVSGKVVDPKNTPMDDITMQLMDMEGQEIRTTQTNENGDFHFNINVDAENFQVSANSNRDILNGVSTLDLVLIQRHILGIASLDSPYKMIAADVNNNKSISAADLVALRKVILGLTNSFPSNSSWRFLDKNQVFEDAKHPWPFIENMTWYINQENADMTFMGVKIGDVNQTAKANANSITAEARSNNSFDVYTDAQNFKKDDIIHIAIKAESEYQLFGLQNTYHFEDALTFIDVTPGTLDFNMDNVGTAFIDKGLLTTSWSNGQMKSIAAGDILYTLNFRAKHNGNIAEVLSNSSDFTPSEAYDEDLNTQKMNIVFRSNTLSSAFEVGQNTPNPFRESTTIPFSIGKESDVNLKVYDLSGRLMHTQSSHFTAGHHNIIVQYSDLNAKGIFTYTIETALGSITRKMVIVD